MMLVAYTGETVKGPGMNRRYSLSLIIGLVASLALASSASAKDEQYDKLVHLYDFDAKAAIDMKQSDPVDLDGVKQIPIDYANPRGARATGSLIIPARKGPFAAVVWVGSGDKDWTSEAMTMAKSGVLSIVLDSSNAGWTTLDAEQVKNGMIQDVVNVRRAVDILRSRPDVDPKRVAYVGHSYGAMIGAVAVAVDRRFKAAVFEVGLLGMSYHIGTSPHAWPAGVRQALGTRLNHFLEVIGPVDAVHYVAYEKPAVLLFQSARRDEGVPQKDAQDFFQAASEPKELKWYDTTHQMNDEKVVADRKEFLSKQLQLSSS
jgi:dienelactone hydrolase